MTYAGDVSIFVTTPEEILAISNAIRCYESATGSVLNAKH